MKRKLLNQYGKIPDGTEVSFIMENADQWGGNTTGMLTYKLESDSWVIKTTRSGEIKIGGYLQAYPNTIKPL